MDLVGNKISNYISLLFGGLVSGLYIYSAIAAINQELELALAQLILFVLFIAYGTVGEALEKTKDITFFKATAPMFGMLIIAIFEFVSASAVGFDDLTLSACIIITICVVAAWTLLIVGNFVNRVSNKAPFMLASKICMSVACGFYAAVGILSVIAAFQSRIFIYIFLMLSLMLFAISVIVDTWLIQTGFSSSVRGISRSIRKVKSITASSKTYLSVYNRLMKQEKLTLNDIKIAEALHNQGIITIFQLEEIKQKYGNQILDENQSIVQPEE